MIPSAPVPTTAEDEPDQSKVHFDLHLYEVFAKGYLSTAGASMSMAEKKSLAWGARLMTLECGIRFLTDYLEGDHYFHIARPDHNLDRARTQFTLGAADGRGFRSDAGNRLPGQSLISQSPPFGYSKHGRSPFRGRPCFFLQLIPTHPSNRPLRTLGASRT